MNRRMSCVSFALCLAAIALPAAASADTVKIGSTLGHAAGAGRRALHGLRGSAAGAVGGTLLCPWSRRPTAW